MNMKKLIDEADFDNVEQISRRWKKDISNQQSHLKDSINDIAVMLNSNQIQKEIIKDSNIQNSFYQPEKDFITFDNTNKQKQVRKRNVQPQIIDEDTEHFKNRLEHLLNTFKTDAVSQFMGMKKSMLDNQKQTIKQDTQKYLTMYEEKHQELLQTKQKLIQVTKQAEKKTIQCELMSNHIAKLNERIKITKYLSRPFSLLYENKEKQKMIKFKFNEAAKSDHRRIKNKCFSGWRNICRQMKNQKDQENMQNTINKEVSDIVGRFQKEMEMLREQLNESVRKNQEYQNNKHLVQENLKKAFLRGMCAMNIQAMGVFGDNDLTNMNMSQNNMTQSNQMNQSINYNNVNNFQDFHPTQRTMINNTNNNVLGSSLMSQKSIQNNQMNSNNASVMIGKMKTESKQHRWKQAPILGVEANEQYEQPRPILVKPSTQGKVIKIIDGKSSTVDKQKPPTSTMKQGNFTGHQKEQNPNINNITKSTLITSQKKI